MVAFELEARPPSRQPCKGASGQETVFRIASQSGDRARRGLPPGPPVLDQNGWCARSFYLAAAAKRGPPKNVGLRAHGDNLPKGTRRRSSRVNLSIESEIRPIIIAAAVRVGLRGQEELGALPRGALSVTQPAPEPPARPGKRLALVTA